MFTHYTDDEIAELKFAIAYKKAIDDTHDESSDAPQKAKNHHGSVAPAPKPLDLGLLSRFGHVVHYNKGAPLIKKGSLSTLMFIVINGEVCVERDANHKVLIKGGEMYGEKALLLGDAEDVVATATMNTAVILLTSDTIEDAIKLVPALGVKIMQYLATKSVS